MSLMCALVLVLWATYETMRFQDVFSPPWPKYPVPILLAFWIMSLGTSLAMSRLGHALATEVFFCLSKKDTHHRIGLPFDRLLGWAYEKEG